ncbi:MAG: bifunctional acetate--CoA ligase family protein/GNAT family N-acetyltransferase [Nitrospirae bacterium]|nr:bifunctional acetate--CoA ligase family protein/GNAT family N-acetyltransferase [Nitrospirota bacterium]
MPIKNIGAFFNPRRIAVIGASEDPNSIGYFIFRNMIGKGFRGVVHPVHPSAEAIQGVEAFRSISAIPHDIELAILAVPGEHMVAALEECGHKRVKGVTILYPDFENRVKDYQLLEDRIRQLSSKYGFRVLGPNSAGFIRPGANLNASLFPEMPAPGSIAFISKSATLSTALLDRAIEKNVGFSYIVSLGAKLDLGFSDLIDYLGVDPETKAIILYIEHIKRGRKFVTAVRSFASSKPIVVVKSGKFDISARVALTHSGFLAGEDKVYDAAFKRAGAVRIDEILDLFYMAETLAKQRRPRGKRLAIVTNAGAPSILAVDALLKLDGELASLGQETLASLRQRFPSIRQIQNPVNLLTNASPADYEIAARTCLQDKGVDGLLVMHIPFFGTRPGETAEAVVSAAKSNSLVPVFTVWMGGGQVVSARDFLNEKGIPTFVTPEQAVRSFLYLHSYDYNLQLLRETPEAILKDFAPDMRSAWEICTKAAEEGRLVLNLNEVKEMLQAYGIPVITTRKTRSEDEAVRMSGEIGYPVALKIDSQKIFHKLRAGGVLLNISGQDAVRGAFRRLKEIAVSHGDPEAHVLIQPMIVKHGLELAIGAKKDPTFGSVIVFGAGGELLEALGGDAVGLPPLNQTLARRMMEETRIYKYLHSRKSYANTLRLLEEMLVRFSQLISDFSCIREIDINPFLVTEKEGFALDAGIVLDRGMVQTFESTREELCPSHLSICPYPFKYVREIAVDGMDAVVRPIRPEDEPLIYDLFKGLSDETIKFRFGQVLTDMPHERLVRYCQIDYDRELAFIAVLGEGSGQDRIIADVRVIRQPDIETAELAILVADEWQGHGIGTMLLDYCIRIAEGIGIKTLWMEILRNNARMLHLARTSGFTQVYADEDMVKVERELSLIEAGRA